MNLQCFHATIASAPTHDANITTGMLKPPPPGPPTPPTPAPPTPAFRPHILMILVDDFGWANAGWHRYPLGSDPEVVTPNLNALVQEGIELNRTYAYKFCSPTRSSLQSGRLPTHVNDQNLRPDISNPKDPVSGFAAIPRNMTGMAAKMKMAGYSTHQVGKWDGMLVFCVYVCYLFVYAVCVVFVYAYMCVCVCVVGLCFWFNKSRHPVGSSGVYFVLNIDIAIVALQRKF